MTRTDKIAIVLAAPFAIVAALGVLVMATVGKFNSAGDMLVTFLSVIAVLIFIVGKAIKWILTDESPK